MKINWCLKCNEAASLCLCGAQALLRHVEVPLGPLTKRVESRIKFLQEKLEGVQRALREEPKDDRPTHTQAGLIGIEVAGSKEPFESRSWVISWRADEARFKAAIKDFEEIKKIVRSSEGVQKPDLSVCVETLTVRDRADWGSMRYCGAAAHDGRGLCKRHDPATKPKRDARGRIIKQEAR